MKKFLLFFLSLTLMVGVLMLASCGKERKQTLNTAGLEFELNETGYTLTGYHGTSKDVRVMYLYNGLPITKIAEGAFAGHNIESITLPFIGGDVNAESASKTSLFGYIFGETEFENSTAVVQNYSAAGTVTYYLPNSLKTVTISEGQKAGAVLNFSFSNCSTIEKINFGARVKEIRANAFLNCTGLTKLSFPSGLTTIMGNAFKGCANLASVTLNGGTINQNAFADCANFKTLTVNAGKIKNSAFKNNATLEKIVLSNCTIEKQAFENCSALTTIEIYKDIVALQKDAFKGCDNLNCTTYNNALYLGNSSNRYVLCLKAVNTDITSCTLHNNTQWVCEGAFSGCTSLETLNLPFIGSTKSSDNPKARQLGYLFGTDAVAGVNPTVQQFDTDIAYNETYYIPSSLKEVNISGDILYYGTFYNCVDIERVSLGNDVSTINKALQVENTCFFGCSSLKEITVGKNNKNYSSKDGVLFDKSGKTLIQYPIGNERTEYEIPATTNKIENSAFSGNTHLQELKLHNALTMFGLNAFDNCDALNKIDYMGSESNWLSITFNSPTSNPLSYAKNLYIDGSKITNLTIPEDITIVKKYALYNCTSLEKLVLHENVLSVEGQAFYGCSSLEEIEINNGTISSSSFAGCDNITTIDIKGGNIGNNAFAGNTSLVTLNLEGGIIGDSAFENCTNLQNVTISEDITSLGLGIFDGATSLSYNPFNGGNYLGNADKPHVLYMGPQDKTATSYAIHEDTILVYGGAFSGCSNIQELTLTFVGGSKNVVSASKSSLLGFIFGDEEFSGATKTVQYFGDDFVAANKAEFYIPSSLRKVTVNGENILFGAFYNCVGIETVVLGSNVKSVGTKAFYGCANLKFEVDETNEEFKAIDFSLYGGEGTSLIQYALGNGGTQFVLPEDVIEILPFAFAGANTLETIVLGNKVEEIFDRAFYGCPALTSIQVDEDNYFFTSIDGNLYSKDRQTLIQYAIGKTDTTFDIHEDVVVINAYAFANCTHLTEIRFENDVTTIETYAFFNCSALKTVEFGENITRIEAFAFYGTALTSATFPQETAGNWIVTKGTSKVVLNVIEGEGNPTNANDYTLENATTAAKFLTKVKEDKGYADYTWTR